MMAIYRLKNCNSFKFLIVLMMVIIYTVDNVKSDQIGCKDIQCPPDIKCPSDSISHVLYEPLQIPPDEEEIKNLINVLNDNDITNINTNTNTNTNNNNNKNDKNDNDINKSHNQKGHIPKFYVVNDDDNDNDNDHQDDTNDHNLNKRSVQYKRKETIKIVPGDYISLIPDLPDNIVNYDQQNTNNLQSNYINKKRKREIEIEIPAPPPPPPPSSSNEPEQQQSTASTSALSTFSAELNSTIEQCCPKKICICKDKCVFPKCEKLGKITIEIESGDGKPGKCCPMYKCIDHEPNCENSKPTDIQKFWIKHCMKCECISGQRFCHNSCVDDVDDDGYNAKSIRECFSAKKQRPYKDGDVWKEDNCTECECVNGEKICQISSCKPKTCRKQIKLPDECCSVCVDDDSMIENNSSLKITTESSLSEENTEKQNQQTISMEFSTTENLKTSTTMATISSSNSSTTVTQSTTTTSTTIPTINESTTQQSSTKCLPPQGHTETETTSTNPHTLSDSDQLFILLGESKKNLILYGIIVVLMILCIIFIGLYVRELTKKISYRSIPSSDSNLSQIPRPIKTPTP